MTASNHDVADAFEPGEWEFTPEVVAEFDKHVAQSVPFYGIFQDAVAELSDWLAPPNALIVDLGVSTGETFRRVQHRHPNRDHRFIGYDESPDMLRAAREKVGDSLDTYEADLSKLNVLDHFGADLTLSLFTLQFLHPVDRAALLRNAHERSAPTGAILVAEKVRLPDARWSEIATELSWDYKADQGIGSEAIRSKARALRGILRPNTADQITADLENAGWVAPTVLFRWHQWCLFGAFASTA